MSSFDEVISRINDLELSDYDVFAAELAPDAEVPDEPTYSVTLICAGALDDEWYFFCYDLAEHAYELLEDYTSRHPALFPEDSMILFNDDFLNDSIARHDVGSWTR